MAARHRLARSRGAGGRRAGLARLVQPTGRAWGAAFWSLFQGRGWPFAAESVIGRVLHVGNPEWAWFDEAGRPTADLVQDATRILLLLVFLGCALLVHRAWRRRARGDRDRPSGEAT